MKSFAIFSAFVFVVPNLGAFQLPGKKVSPWQGPTRTPLRMDLNDRVVVLETKTELVEKNLQEIKQDIEKLSNKNDDSFEKLSNKIEKLSNKNDDSFEKLSNKIDDSFERLSKKIDDVNNKFIPIYVFLAVFSTATGMANFKDFAAFFK